MAARLNRMHQDTVRQKIQADKIVLSLQNHVAGKSELSPTQIQAAKILLDKSISNAPQIVESTLKGDKDNPIRTEVSIAPPNMSVDEWLAKYRNVDSTAG
jgi:hypothetical protein